MVRTFKIARIFLLCLLLLNSLDAFSPSEMKKRQMTTSNNRALPSSTAITKTKSTTTTGTTHQPHHQDNFPPPPPPSNSKKNHTPAPARRFLSLQVIMTMILVGVSAAVTTAAVAPQPGWAIDIANGSKLFQGSCTGCHANGMNFVSEKKTLKKEAIIKYRKTTEPNAIQEFIQKGMPHRFMPFANEYSDTDYDDVVSFVLDQALNDKW